MKAILDAGIGIKSICGGKGTCGKCRILILDNKALPPNTSELKALSNDEIKNGVRLACQQNFSESLNVYIPASSLTEEQKLQVTGAEEKVEVEPIIKKYFLKLDPPTLSDMKSDYFRLKEALFNNYSLNVNKIDNLVLKEMPKILRQNNWQVTVSVRTSFVGQTLPLNQTSSISQDGTVSKDLGQSQTTPVSQASPLSQPSSKSQTLNGGQTSTVNQSLPVDQTSHVDKTSPKSWPSPVNQNSTLSILNEQNGLNYLNDIGEPGDINNLNEFKNINEINEIILIEGGNKTNDSYGIAIDLGTTKIAVLLVNLNTGENIDKAGIMNPQISFGEDVMSRINYAMQSASNLENIQRVVIDQINKTIEELCQKNNIKKEEVLEISLVGNTAMHHLFLGFDVKQLGLSPFVAVTSESIEIKARELGIKIAPGGYVYLLPVIAGFVGSDHVAMLFASGIYKEAGNVIGIDIGTNTEIVLKSSNKMESVSTASGPAFEGAHIKYGMRAAPGAIERVVIDKDTCMPKIQTINDKDPIGICGSGILDAIAEMLKAKIIDRRGKFISQSNCICKDDKGELRYLLDPKASKKTCDSSTVSITQKDIVEIQLAKSAIRTGINILLESAGIDFTQIDKIIIAGAFGSYIDPKNVVDIGMFPKIDLKKIFQVGNAAAVGAKMVLVSKSLRAKAEEIAKKINYLELTVFPTFTDNFVKSTLFPEESN